MLFHEAHCLEAALAQVQKSTESSSLAEVIDRVLDKGIVIDAFVKVSLVGIELLSIEARERRMGQLRTVIQMAPALAPPKAAG